jgi:hypothetical protein
MLPQFQSVYTESLDKITHIIETVIQQSELDTIGNNPVDTEQELVVDLKLDEISIEPTNQNQYAVVFELYDIFHELVSIYQQINELENFKTTIQDLKAATADKNYVPASVKKNTLKEDFARWLSGNKCNTPSYNDGF